MLTGALLGPTSSGGMGPRAQFITTLESTLYCLICYSQDHILIKNGNISIESSPYCLNVSENKGTVKVVTDWYLPEMSNLLHIPTKPENDYYTIGDVMANGQNLSGEFINVLAVVKQVVL